MKPRRLTILLTRYPTPVFRLLCRLKGCDYLHASLGFEEDRNVFYSFGFKGFRRETLTHCLRPGREPYACALYELEVPEPVYRNVKAIISCFEQRKSRLRYTRFGAALALLSLGCRWEDHYFCSQFVAHVLAKAHAVTLEKDSSLYLAEDFSRLAGVCETYRGNLLGLVKKYGIAASCAA